MARFLISGVLFAATASALNGIVAPASVSANSDFQVTFQNENSDTYHVYLAAALTGTNGPAGCRRAETSSLEDIPTTCAVHT